MTAGESVARDARPPLLLVALLNPVMRVVLRTPLGRLVRPVALLEFDGRRTARHYRIPVGWHELDRGHVVCTPAPWRVNFRNGIAVSVTFRGRRQEFTGTLVDDPDAVAAALQHLTEQHGSIRAVGVDVPRGHRITEDDVRAVGRALIRFTPRTENHERHRPTTPPEAASRRTGRASSQVAEPASSQARSSGSSWAAAAS
jgi:hypothetical protein